MKGMFTDGELAIESEGELTREELGKYAFARAKRFAEEGNVLMVPIYLMAGRRAVDGRPTTEGHLVAIDQGDMNQIIMYRTFGATMYENFAHQKAAQVDAFLFARITQFVTIPDEDGPAWEGKDYHDHPQHWHALEVTVYDESHPDEKLVISGRANTCPGVPGITISEPTINVMLKRKAPKPQETQ